MKPRIESRSGDINTERCVEQAQAGLAERRAARDGARDGTRDGARDGARDGRPSDAP